MTGTALILSRMVAALAALLLAAGLFAWMNATGDAINDAAAALGALKHPSQTPWTLSEFPGPYYSSFMVSAGVGSVLFAGVFASILMLGVDGVATHLSRGWLALKGAWSGTRQSPMVRNYSRGVTARAFLAGLWALPALVVVAYSPALWRPRLEVQIDQTFITLGQLEFLADLAGRRLRDSGTIPGSLEEIVRGDTPNPASEYVANGYSYAPTSATTGRFCAVFAAAKPADASEPSYGWGCSFDPAPPFNVEISRPGPQCYEVDLTTFERSFGLCLG